MKAINLKIYCPVKEIYEDISLTKTPQGVTADGYDVENEIIALKLTKFNEGAGVFLIALEEAFSRSESLSKACANIEDEIEKVAERYKGVSGPHLAKYSVSPIVSGYLSYSSTVDIRACIARFGSFSQEGFTRMLNDPELDVICNAIANPQMPVSLLEPYLDHPENLVREFIAATQQLTIEMQIILAKDSNRRVKIALADNESIHDRVLMVLADDDYSGVLTVLARRQGCSEEVLEKLLVCEEAAQEVAARSDLSHALALKLTNDGDSTVRQRLADNQHDTGILDILAHDTMSSVREAVAANYDIDSQTMLLLAGDDYPSVRQALSKNPYLSDEAKEMLEEMGQGMGTSYQGKEAW